MRRAGCFLLGLLSFSLGITIIGWCAYSFLVPNEHFHFRLIDAPRLLMPVALIWVGWSWMRTKATKSTATYDSEIELTLQLSGTDYGTVEERQKAIALKHHIERALADMELGEIDGEEFGDGTCTIFIQTNTPSKAADVIRTLLVKEGIERYTLTNSK